ncbi:hypothetical protein [Faecalibacterium sp. 9]|uniref:hypothetical protein n=1 Tax=Faecalibacterium sp. 9 TaxID=3402018 RepID=UPI003AACEE23
MATGGAAKHFNDALSQMQNSAGATETADQTMTDTFQHKAETMQTSAAQNFGITLYGRWNPLCSRCHSVGQLPHPADHRPV